MYDEGFKIKQSPFKQIDEFKKASRDERVLMSVGISPEDHELIEKYIRQRDPDFDNAKFLKELMLNFINNTAMDKQCFDDIYVLLLLPKTQDPDELEDNGQIVGAIQFQDTCHQANILKHTFMTHNKYYKNRHTFIYDLKEFNEDLYNNFLPFDDMQERAFFCVDESIQHDFVKTKIRLSEVYFELDLDNCYFTVFSLNNYFDIMREGQYRSSYSSYYHEGALVLLDFSNDLKLCLTMNWSFNKGNIEIALEICDEDDFDSRIYVNDNDELIEEYVNLTEDLSPEEILRHQMEAHISLIKFNDLTIKEKLEENERSKKIIESIGEELERLSKDNS